MSTAQTRSSPPEPSLAGRRWIILADGTSHDAVDDALAGAGLRLVNAVARTETHPWQRIFARPGGSLYVHDVVDHVLGARYLTVVGDDVESVDRELQAKLSCLPAARLIESSSDADVGVATRALRLLGLAAAGRGGDTAVGALRRAMEDPDSRLREAAGSALAFALSMQGNPREQ